MTDNPMNRNIEIKAAIKDIETFENKVASLTQGKPVEIIQDDIFFRCETGRLKLRSFSDGTCELIFYRRDNSLGPKVSCYQRAAINDPVALLNVLSSAYERTGRVKKHRTVYHVGRTRIHLDRVKELGNFMELEVVLAEGEAVDDGIKEADALMRYLDVAAEDLIEDAYVDILNSHGTSGHFI